LVRRLATPKNIKLDRITRNNLEKKVCIGPITKDHDIWYKSENEASKHEG